MFYRGKIDQLDVVVSYSGCGKVLSSANTQQMISTYKPKYVIHYGAAGGISPHIRVGDIVLASKSLEVDYLTGMGESRQKPEALPDKTLYDSFRESFKKNNLGFVEGPIVCQDCDVVTPEVKEKLWMEYNGECVCWEGAAVGRICNFNNIPHLHIRGITDLANDAEQVTVSFETMVGTVSKKLVKYLKCGLLGE
jgi:5'-methylthioadenosine/S-adenosylhomocysteine nucleosidase